jgi:hypothetical protein
MTLHNSPSSSRDIQAAFRDWIPHQHWRRPYAVTLTMKQHLWVAEGTKSVRVQLDPDIASDNLRRFLNTLNRKALGHLADRHGRKIPVIPILEGGNGKHLHYHLTIDCPFEGDPEGIFEGLIRLAWSKTLWSDYQVDIQPGCDGGWTDYATKLRDKPDFSRSIDWTNLTPPSANSPVVRHRWV